MIYNLNDIYYINRAVDLWLTTEDENYPDDENNENDTKERGMTDD